VVIDEPTAIAGGSLGADQSPGAPANTSEPAAEVLDGTVEPEAANFLLVGTDNNACLDPGSKYAPYILGRENFGERADVIMVWRVNPDTGGVAALSLPRDLYVRIDGGRQGRINAAFDAAHGLPFEGIVIHWHNAPAMARREQPATPSDG
jgi:anionic cell wall polymer biosynthesis LytR-Cps2A-Psr (LCP) family protein